MTESINCPWCQTLISDEAKVCPACHAYHNNERWRPVHADRQDELKRLKSINTAVTIVALLALLIMCGAALTAIASTNKSSSSYTPVTTCPRSHINYPYC